MASILIVEDDGLVAGQMARTLREAGHTPALARDGRSALQAAAEGPDVVLLDLGLPDVPGEEVLQRLKSRPGTAHIPVLVVTGRAGAATRLIAWGGESVAEILLKPVSGGQLCQAVDGALAVQGGFGAGTVRMVQEHQRDLLERILVDGPDYLAFHVCRRMSLDRMEGRGSMPGETPTWGQIAEWAGREGLVNPEEASLLRRIPLTKPRRPPGASA